ncbi:MAG: hypothetical protein R3B47_06225 [Bacteroidia bacterium]
MPLSVEKANKLLKEIGGEKDRKRLPLADIFNQDETGFEEDFVEKKVGF